MRAAHPHARVHVVQTAAVDHCAERRWTPRHLVERMASKPLPFAVELRSGPLACRDACRSRSVSSCSEGRRPSRERWHVGPGPFGSSAFSFAFLAPGRAALRPLRLRGGLRLGDRAVVFLVEDVGIGLVVLYAVLVSCLLGALAMTALSDPGMWPRPFTSRRWRRGRESHALRVGSRRLASDADDAIAVTAHKTQASSAPTTTARRRS